MRGTFVIPQVPNALFSGRYFGTPVGLEGSGLALRVWEA